MIREDKSYLSKIDLLAIEKGIAKLDINSIRMEREISKKERIENKKLFETLSKEEWERLCYNKKRRASLIIKPIIDILDKNFIIYQYKKKISYNDVYDLFFNGDINCLSSARISFNGKKSLEERQNDINQVINCLKKID